MVAYHDCDITYQSQCAGGYREEILGFELEEIEDHADENDHTRYKQESQGNILPAALIQKQSKNDQDSSHDQLQYCS